MPTSDRRPSFIDTPISGLALGYFRSSCCSLVRTLQITPSVIFEKAFEVIYQVERSSGPVGIEKPSLFVSLSKVGGLTLLPEFSCPFSVKCNAGCASLSFHRFLSPFGCAAVTSIFLHFWPHNSRFVLDLSGFPLRVSETLPV